MALLIKKLEQGDKVAPVEKKKPSLYYEGIGDILADDISSNIAHNADSYLDSMGITDQSDRQKIKERAVDASRLIQKGTVTTDASGKYNFNTPGYEHLESTGQFQKKWKKYTKDDNYYNNLAFSLISKAVKDSAGGVSNLGSGNFSDADIALGEASKVGSSTGTRSIYNGRWDSDISTQLFGGGEDRLDWWYRLPEDQRLSKMKEIIQRRINLLQTPDFDDKYNFKVSGYDNKDNYINALQNLQAGLNTNWDIDLESLLISSGGIGLEKLLNKNLSLSEEGRNREATSKFLENHYTGKENFDWAEGYSPESEYSAAKYRFGPGVQAFYDKDTKRLLYLDGNGQTLNTSALSSYGNIYNPYQEYDGFWYNGKYYPKDVDFRKENIPSEIIEEYKRANYNTIGGDYSYRYNKELSYNPILENLATENNMDRYVDLSDMFSIKNKYGNVSLIGIYTGDNTSNRPDKVYWYDENNNTYKEGAITYSEGDGHKFISTDNKFVKYLPSLNRTGSISPLEMSERPIYIQGLKNMQNYAAGLMALQINPNDTDLINQMLNDGVIRVLSKDKQGFSIIGSADFGPDFEGEVVQDKYGRTLILDSKGDLAWRNNTNGAIETIQKRVHIPNNDFLKDSRIPKITVDISSMHKKGGTIKKAQGGTTLEQAIEEDRIALENRNKAKKSITKSPSKDIKSTNLGLTAQEQYKKYARDEGNFTMSQAFEDKDVALSKAEKAELLSIGTDIASAIVGLVPTPITMGIGAIGGAASSLTSYFAGLTKKDSNKLAETGNLLLNLGLDLSTLIPGLGVSRFTKIANRIYKARKFLMPALAAAGMGNMAHTILSKNYKDYTKNDIMAIASGIRAITTSRNLMATSSNKTLSGLKSKPSLKYTNTNGEIKSLELKEGQVEALKNLKTYRRGASKDKVAFAENILKTSKVEGKPVTTRTAKTLWFGSKPKVTTEFDPNTRYTGNSWWYRYMQSTRDVGNNIKAGNVANKSKDIKLLPAKIERVKSSNDYRVVPNKPKEIKLLPATIEGVKPNPNYKVTPTKTNVRPVTKTNTKRTNITKGHNPRKFNKNTQKVNFAKANKNPKRINYRNINKKQFGGLLNFKKLTGLANLAGFGIQQGLNQGLKNTPQVQSNTSNQAGFRNIAGGKTIIPDFSKINNSILPHNTTRINTPTTKTPIVTNNNVATNNVASNNVASNIAKGFRYHPDKYSWERQKALESYIPEFSLDIDDYIKTGKSAKDYMDAFNLNQDNYETIKRDNYYTNRDGSIKGHQEKFRGVSGRFDNQYLRNGTIGPAGASSDSENIDAYDDYYGIRTDNRYLSDYSEEQIKKLNQELSRHGLEYYYNSSKADGRQGRLRMIPGQLENPRNPLDMIGKTKIPGILNNPVKPNAGIPKNPSDVVDSPKIPGTPSDSSAREGNLDKIIKKDKMWTNIPLLRGIDLGAALYANNRIGAIKETAHLKSPYDIHSNVVGDLGTRTAMYNQAADLERWSNVPRTADGSLHMAAGLDARMRGNQLRTQGHLADSQMIKETGLRALQNQFQNKAVRNEVANRNIDVVNHITSVNKQNKKATILANTQAFQNLIGELRHEAMVDRAMVNQLNMEKARNDANTLIANEMNPLEKQLNIDLQNWKNKGYSEDSFYNTQAYKDYMEKYKGIQGKHFNTMYDAQRKAILNKKYLPYNLRVGGKLSKEERSELQREKNFHVSVENSKKLFRKAMDNVNNNTNKRLLALDATVRHLIVNAFK